MSRELAAGRLRAPAWVARRQALAAVAVALAVGCWLGGLRIPGIRTLSGIGTKFAAAPTLVKVGAPRPAELWLGDFEDQAGLDRWQARGVTARLCAEHVSHGASAVEIGRASCRERVFRVV